MFTHLHGYSTFSFLEAIGTPVHIVKRAKELGMKGVALTDLWGMYSAIKLYQSAKDAGITPILWVELGFVVNISEFRSHMDIANICLLATSSKGYLNLIKIVSFANTKWIEKQAKVDFEVLQQYSQGIKVFFGGEKSWIGKKIFNNEAPEKITELLQRFMSIFGKDNVLLEVVAQKYTDIPVLKCINDTILQYAKKLDLNVIVDNGYKYVYQKDKETWEIALAVKDGKKIYDEDRRKPKWDFSFQTENEIIATCIENGYTREQVETWIATNNAIVEETDIDISMHQSLFPVHQTPPQMQEKYEQFKDEMIVKK